MLKTIVAGMQTIWIDRCPLVVYYFIYSEIDVYKSIMSSDKYKKKST